MDMFRISGQQKQQLDMEFRQKTLLNINSDRCGIPAAEKPK